MACGRPLNAVDTPDEFYLSSRFTATFGGRDSFTMLFLEVFVLSLGIGNCEMVLLPRVEELTSFHCDYCLVADAFRHDRSNFELVNFPFYIR